MTKLNTTANVEIPCKTLCKTQCINIVKLCANLLFTTTGCVNPPFSHHFPTHKTQTFTHNSTPIPNQSFPLFHQAYYYNN